MVEDLLSDVNASDGQEEHSVEEENILPTKYPMSKEQYAQTLRETFNIFNKFKEAHKTPVPVTIVRSTERPKPTSQAVTRKPANQKKENNSKKNEPKPAVKNKGTKGEQADLEQADIENEDDDLTNVIKLFQNFRNRNKPRSKAEKKAALAKKKAQKKAKLAKKKAQKKGKGKKKDKDESSEENEKLPPRPRPLVAVPPPHIRQKIHWRSGTTLVKDGVYHLLFGKKATKPLPPRFPHFHPGNGRPPPNGNGKKPVRHDTHYFDLQHDETEAKNNKDAKKPSIFHRLRTSESVEDDIPPPPPFINDQQEERRDADKKPGKPGAEPKPSLAPGLLIATRKPAKVNSKVSLVTISQDKKHFRILNLESIPLF